MKDTLQLARESGFRTGTIIGGLGDTSHPFVDPIGQSCLVELERFRVGAVADHFASAKPDAYMFTVRRSKKGRSETFAAIDYVCGPDEEIIAKEPLFLAPSLP